MGAFFSLIDLTKNKIYTMGSKCDTQWLLPYVAYLTNVDVVKLVSDADDLAFDDLPRKINSGDYEVIDVCEEVQQDYNKESVLYYIKMAEAEFDCILDIILNKEIINLKSYIRFQYDTYAGYASNMQICTNA